jgi:F-type H+-transporting ATPase subunit alpha
MKSPWKKDGAMPYTTIVAASASDPAPMQFYAPFAGAALSESFSEIQEDQL